MPHGGYIDPAEGAVSAVSAENKKKTLREGSKEILKIIEKPIDK